MASIKKISELTEITSANSNDYLIINQDGNTRKITVKNLNINGGIISVNGSSEFIDVEEYGAVGDGTTDDTAAFQRALDSGLNITATKGKTYLITNPISMHTDNQILDMKNAKIIMNHSTTVTSRNNDLISLFTIDNNPNLGDMVLGTQYTVSSITLSDGYITLSNVSNLSIGDFLRLNFNQGGSYQHDGTSFKPMLEVVAEITNIDGNNVYLDYHTPNGGWSLDTTTPSNKFTVVGCNKVKMVKNVVIRNVYIEDETPYTEDLTKSMSGITCRFADNVTVENVRMNNLLLNAVTFVYAHNFTCNNLKVTNARRGTGGKGYCLRMLACNKGKCDGIHGYLVRHVFDVSAGAFIEVRNATGYCPNDVAGAFSLHGKFEHDLYFYNLSGIDLKKENATMGFGSGAYFGNAVDNVFVYNSNVKTYIQNFSMYGRVYFENCDVCEYVALPRASYVNCNVYKSSMGYYCFNTTRGTDIKLYKKFVNCTINLPTKSNNYTYLQVVNCNITSLNVSSTYALISNNTITGLTINDSTKTANSTSSALSIQGNLFI